jgi:glycine cleavage system aminomethyltransferase T
MPWGIGVGNRCPERFRRTVGTAMSETFRVIYDDQPLVAQRGDSLAAVAIRNGQAPAFGGPLCLSGDCGNCVATINGTSWVRTCQTAALPGTIVTRHPGGAAPPMTEVPTTSAPIGIEYQHLDAVVVGAGRSGTTAADELRAAGRSVTVFDAHDGFDVVGIYPGPMLAVRTAVGMLHAHAHEVVLATGSATVLPVCPGNTLHGIYTERAVAELRAARIDLGRVVTITEMPIRFDGSNGRVSSVTTTTEMIEADSVIVSLGGSPRDVLVRMHTFSPESKNVRVVGSAAQAFPLPPDPVDGIVCACSKTTVDDLQGVWDRGFRETELIKRSSLCGTGTCQGAACMPHLQAFIAARSNNPADATPFTARAAAKQVTMGEAAAGFFSDPWKRTPLHDEHLALGAKMDRFGGWWRPWDYGDHVAEYWAVREGVSLGDVSTLGKLIVSGPDSIEFLERIYPTTIADIKPGRSRYVLILNERGHLFDDGMVLREEDRIGADGVAAPWFTLSFTSGGATNAEAWLRDWAETWNLNVHIMDRTMSLAAINVTGPFGRELLQRCGVAPDDVPKFLQHRRIDVAGVPCHAMRLSFTGEASWELHHPWNRSVELWTALMAAGKDLGIRPHGLKALFGLRLEKGHVIVGMDTELDTTPRRINHEWAVKMGKPFFLGQEALARTAPIPDQRKMIGLRMPGEAPTEGCPLLASDGKTIIGHITTTFASPLFGYTIALAMLKRDWNLAAGVPNSYIVDGRVATLTDAPFYDPEGLKARA